MEFIISAVSDVGISKSVNQDGLFVSKGKTSAGNVAFAVMCDGMGGFSFGEIASTALVEAFSEWFLQQFPCLSKTEICDEKIVQQWTAVAKAVNKKIKRFGTEKQCRLGSTITVLLLTEERYFIMNIGDTRAYVLKKIANQLTVDHTLIEHQIRLGNISRKQADISSMRNVITRCVGVTEEVYPDFFFGTTKKEAVYLLCTDGFRHKISEEEILNEFSKNVIHDSGEVYKSLTSLVALNKERKEKDNISVISIITKNESRDIDAVADGYDDVTVRLPDMEESENTDFMVEEIISYTYSDTIL